MFTVIKVIFHMLFSIIATGVLLYCSFLAFRKAAAADSVWDLIRELIPDSPYTFKDVVLRLFYDFFIGVPAISWHLFIGICTFFSSQVKDEGKEKKKA